MKETEKIGLKVNDTKTKYMHFSRRQNRNTGPLQIEGLAFERVDYFKYLVVIFKNDHKEEPEIQNRLDLANRCLHACNGILSSKALSHKTNIRLHKAIISPVLLHGSETWRMSKKDEKN